MAYNWRCSLKCRSALNQCLQWDNIYDCSSLLNFLSVGWEKEERIGPIPVLKKNKKPLSVPEAVQGPPPVLAGELSSRLLLGGWCLD